MLSYALRRIAGTVPDPARHHQRLVSVSCAWPPVGRSRRSRRWPPAVRANLDRLYGLDQPADGAVRTLPARSAARGFRALAQAARFQRGPSSSTRACRSRPPWDFAAILLAVLTRSFPPGVLAALWAQTAAPTTASPRSPPWRWALPSFRHPVRCSRWCSGCTCAGLPVAGWQHGARRANLVLPVLTLALPVAAYLARLTRASLLEVLRGALYVRSARARGPGRCAPLLWRHALPPGP